MNDRRKADGATVRRWEQLPHGWVFYFRCPCGFWAQPVYEADLESLGGFLGVESQSLGDFLDEHPDCMHWQERRKGLYAPPVETLSEYVGRLEQELTVHWNL